LIQGTDYYTDEPLAPHRANPHTICRPKSAKNGAGRENQQFIVNRQLRKTDNTDVVSNLSYDYYNGGNNNGRIQKITDADSSYTTTFGYDDYNRLSSASASAYTRSCSYDNWGNLTGVTSTGAGESGSYSLSYAANGSGAPSTNRINNPQPSFGNGMSLERRFNPAV